MAEPFLDQPQQLQPHHQHQQPQHLYPVAMEDEEPSTTVDITSASSVFDDGVDVN